VDYEIDQESQDFVREQVESGKYGSEGEVVKDGLELLRLRQRKQDELRDHVQRAIERGGALTSSDLLASLERRKRAR